MHASIAERIAYGTPLEPINEDTRIHSADRSTTALFGRVLLSTIFLTSGLATLTDTGGAVGYMNTAGVPNAEVLVYVAGMAVLLGGLSLMLGLLARVGALGLFVMLIPVQYYFHAFWNMDGQEAKTQLVQFMKNLAIMGGLLMVVARGPGRFSVDERIRRPLTP